jgi:hypothetical protein
MPCENRHRVRVAGLYRRDAVRLLEIEHHEDGHGQWTGLSIHRALTQLRGPHG